MGKTLFDKIWDQHVVETVKDGPQILYIDNALGENVDTLDVYFHRVLNIHIEIYLVSLLPLEKQIKL